MQSPHESPAWLAAVVESSPDAIVASTLDGVILSWNSGAQRILGYTAEEMIGQNAELLHPQEIDGETARMTARIAPGARNRPMVTETLHPRSNNDVAGALRGTKVLVVDDDMRNVYAQSGSGSGFSGVTHVAVVVRGHDSRVLRASLRSAFNGSGETVQRGRPSRRVICRVDPVGHIVGPDVDV